MKIERRKKDDVKEKEKERTIMSKYVSIAIIMKRSRTLEKAKERKNKNNCDEKNIERKEIEGINQKWMKKTDRRSREKQISQIEEI